MFLITKVVLLFVFVTVANCSLYWTWRCEEFNCIKTRIQPGQRPISPALCELTCNEYSRVWPMPSKRFEITRETTGIDLDDGITGSGTNSPDLQAMAARFRYNTYIYNDKNKNQVLSTPCKTKINFKIDDINLGKFEFETNEEYLLEITTDNECVHIDITSQTIFGARHALETLSQVLVYDEVQEVYVVPKKLIVEDGPKYPYRGLMLDTGHNFFSKDIIKRAIEGMAINKLNTFHWHLTDSSSFAYQSKSIPELSELGAYSDKHVYTVEDVQEIVDFARIRGIRIIPEFDGPSHVGEGWQDTGLVECFNKQPWDFYCSEPPCGLFDPTKDELYSTLRLLYKDLIEAFDPVAFHYGGDEVKFECWKEIESIRKWMQDHDMSPDNENDEGYVQLWDYYQNMTYKVFSEEMKKEIPGIIWTSTLTQLENLHYLPKDKYIIHVWTSAEDETIANLLANDYRMLFTYYDSMYLDCGFHSWVGDGFNWCAPYSTWKHIYETSPAKSVENFGEELNKQHLIMGAEVTLWTETADDPSAENRIWPRTAAFAERLWAEPASNWTSAQYRLDSHRQRMVKLGIQSDTLHLQWCYLNQDSCTDWTDGPQ